MLKITVSTPSNRRTWGHALLGATLLLLTTGAPAVADDTTVYRVGIVPQFDSRTIHDIWTPILAQLQTRTDLRFELVGSPNIPAFEKKFEQQEFDFAYMNPYHVALAASHYVPLVRDVATQLQGIIVVHNDSPIKKLSDLQGKNMDFPAPNSLAASLLPRAKLNELGITVQVSGSRCRGWCDCQTEALCPRGRPWCRRRRRGHPSSREVAWHLTAHGPMCGGCWA